MSAGWRGLPAWLWPPWWRGGSRRIDGKAVGRMFADLRSDANTAAVRDAHDVAKASLLSVVELTSYEDNKVARLLTVVAFLSAVVGAVFTRFSTVYAWNDAHGAVKAAYVLFFIYTVLVALAATVLIGAIRPTFNLRWTGGHTGSPDSLFFYQKILEVSPNEWAKAFTESADIRARAAGDYVAETYFVAEKIAKKLWWVKRGVYVLIVAMASLVAFLALAGATFITVGPTATPPAVVVVTSPTPTPTPSAVPSATKSPTSSAPTTKTQRPPSGTHP